MGYFLFGILLVALMIIITYIYRKIYEKVRLNKISEQNLFHKTIQKSNFTDDISGLNCKLIDKVYYPQNLEKIRNIVLKAISKKKKISMKGQSHTMGGQTIIENGYIIDMKYMNQIISFDKEKLIVVVQPGLTWCDLIKFLNTFGLSPMTLQSYSSFSIGGTISVNAHGITNDFGVYNSVEEIKIVTVNNELLTCSQTNNTELFELVIGGYGLFGIIYEITLKLVHNVALNMETINTNIYNFVEEFDKTVNDDSVDIKLARINILNFDDISFHVFRKQTTISTKSNKVVSTLTNDPHQMSLASQLLYKWVIPTKTGQKIRYMIEKHKNKPLDWNDDCDRNKLLYETALPLAKLYNPLINLDKTHILQEFFIPRVNFNKWLLFLKRIFTNIFNNVTLLNITIRYIKQDKVTFLKYAKKDMFAFVLYYRIKRNNDADNELQVIHNQLVNKTLKLDGTFYLPYRHHYDKSQLQRAYPEIEKFFELKNKYDPNNVFSNMWYEKYSDSLKIHIDNNNSKVIKKNTNSSNFTLQTIDNNSKYNYQTIFSSDVLKYKFKEFLKNIFYQINPNELYDVIEKIMIKNENNISDIDVFKQVQTYIKSQCLLKIFSYKYRQFRLLRDQVYDFTKQMHTIISQLNIKDINGYMSIGDSGRCVKIMKTLFNITGPTYIVHDNQSMIDIIERNSILSLGKFIQFDYMQVNELNVSKNSVGLITCLMGLHHFPVKLLSKFLTMIHDILIPGALFIIREHNCEDRLFPIVNCAHNVFNAVTGVDEQSEISEIRQFRPIHEWIKIMKHFGFENTELFDIQKNDSTEDYMMCFRKIVTDDNKPKQNILRHIDKNKISYVRDQNQTYQTVPEWYLVDLAQTYGNFMEHTPYYMFPYWNTIILYWKLFLNGLFVVKENSGWSSALFNSYTLMNCVIGLTSTIIFGILSLLSVVPRLLYSIPGNVEDTHIGAIVIHDNNTNFNIVDKRIKVIKTEKLNNNNNNNNMSLIQIPRYKPFKEIVVKFVKENINFDEICGQNQIQIKILDYNTNFITDNLSNTCKIITKYKILDSNDKYEIILSVQINKLIQVIKLLLQNNICVVHIYDF